MESVLNLQNSSPLKLFHFGYLRPLRANFILYLQQKGVFSLGPITCIDIRLKEIEPSLTALPTNPVWQLLSNLGPVFLTKFRNLLSECLVFLMGPKLTIRGQNFGLTVNLEFSILQFFPSFKALDFGLIWKLLTDSVPSVVSILIHEFYKLDIFFQRPKLFGTIFLELVNTCTFVGTVSHALLSYIWNHMGELICYLRFILVEDPRKHRHSAHVKRFLICQVLAVERGNSSAYVIWRTRLIRLNTWYFTLWLEAVSRRQ